MEIERIENEGSDLFTSFFQKKSPFNETPSKDFDDFMEYYDIDFMRGKVRKRNG